MKKYTLITALLIFLMTLLPGPTLAAPSSQDLVCNEEVVVQANDWLSKLADKYYGDVLAYPAIVAATNRKSATEPSFTRIDSADVIEVGWKLCIVSQGDAQALLAAQSTTTTYPLTLIDGLGREVTISANPQRIISLMPSNTEILFALGLSDRVVGVTEFDTYPPEVQEKEKIGGTTVRTISIEAILALEPDLVLAHDEHHQEVIDTLTDNGITVFAVNTTGLLDIYRAFDWIGQIAGIQAEADALKRQLQADVADITARVQQIPLDQRPTVYYEVWDEPLMTAGPNTFIGQLIDLAGANNVFADVTEDYPIISAEELVARDPDVILGPETHVEPLTAEVIAARPGWSDITAVQNGQIYPLNDDIISRPGPRLGQALQLVVEALYPEVFGQ